MPTEHIYTLDKERRELRQRLDLCISTSNLSVIDIKLMEDLYKTLTKSLSIIWEIDGVLRGNKE